jgi:hypothetical protein
MKKNPGPKHQHLKGFIGEKATLHLNDGSTIMCVKIQHITNGKLFYKAKHEVNSVPLSKIEYATPVIDYDNI